MLIGMHLASTLPPGFSEVVSWLVLCTVILWDAVERRRLYLTIRKATAHAKLEYDLMHTLGVGLEARITRLEETEHVRASRSLE